MLRQYDVRERQFEAIVKAKDLEGLLARARAEELVHSFFGFPLFVFTTMFPFFEMGEKI